MEERARAVELLSRYRVMRPWARRRPEGLAITEVEVTGPVQVVLRSIYEGRGVRYQLRAAAQRTLENVQGPDPWSAPIRFPPGAPVGTEHVFGMEDLAVPMDCGLCSATGDQSCPACGGEGTVRHGRYSSTCGSCHGRCVIVCGMCEGSGG